jgi:hypothetical protein
MSDSNSFGPHRYEVEKILNHRIDGSELQFLVKWLGYDDPGDDTWEPISQLQDCAYKIAEYQRSLQPFSVVLPPS